MKKYGVALLFSGMIALLLAACTSTSANVSSGGNSTNSGTVVHMAQTSFAQSSVTIRKGSSLILTNDTSAVHIIANGSWVNGTAQSKQEPGSPAVNQIQFGDSGQSETIGPFTTAGTYHLYCDVHPNMNLTVIVQ